MNTTIVEAIDRIEIPTPFGVGSVNCYLIDDGPLTVIDPGPATGVAYRTFDYRLGERGHEVADVDRVLVTHSHRDHFGLVNRIVAHSDATVLAHENAVDRLEQPLRHFEREQEFFAPFLRSMGVPDTVAETVTRLPEPYIRHQDPLPVDRSIAGGESLDGDLDLEILETPGHAPGSICFLSHSAGVVFTGDHVLSDVTPNPLLSLDPDDRTERTRSLPTYLASLRRLRSRDVEVGFGGHGDPIQDLSLRIDETIEHHRDRKESIAEIVSETEPTTAYEVMQSVFPDLPAADTFPGMSEAIGHLDLLEDEGRVRIEPVDGRLQYRFQTI